MTPSEVEAVLRQHPAVRDVAVILREMKQGDCRFIGYVVPETGYLEKVLSGTEEEHKRLQKWRKTFDLTQFGKEAALSPLAFNIAGWNSSYTRKPIPPEEMREWVDETVKDILALQPNELLEIGCGTGLLLLRVAPKCERYVATDFSSAVLQRLKEQMAQLERPLPGVTLLERSADNFEGLGPSTFDTVIINSVVHYFPSLTYLVRVLEQMIDVAKPGGKIFVGDLRSLPLLETYAASVEAFQAPPAMNLTELRERVRRRARQQEQLVVSPSFFLALQRRLPRISTVEVRPRLGRFENELTKFRFNATLSLEMETEKCLDPSWLDCSDMELPMQFIKEMLEKPDCEMLALRDVRNARLARDLDVQEELKDLSSTGSTRTVAEIRDAPHKSPARGVHPQALSDMAERLGFCFDLSWLGSSEDGSFDVLFRRRSPDTQPAPVQVKWPQPASFSADLWHHSNTPGQTSLGEKLIHSLVEFSKQKLPATLVPAALVLVEAIPREPHGELNTEALPAPDISHA